VQLSPTGILTLDQCPYQYELTYIRGLRDQYATAKPYFTMANHVHAVLRDFFRIVPVEARTVETIEQMLRERWRQYRGGFRTMEDERRWGEKALAQLRSFVLTEDITVHPFMLERPLEAHITPGVVLRARADRVDKESDGSLHLIDYKTGRVPQNVDFKQLHLSALALARDCRLPVARASFKFLSDASTITTEVKDDTLQQATWKVMKAADTVRSSKTFQATPGDWCRLCDFPAICSRGTQFLKEGRAWEEEKLELLAGWAEVAAPPPDLEALNHGPV
jgi:putative RecB family exonuclease